MTVRTRFAPSPTGYLHVGGLRTALYAYIYAKKHQGTFLLRIEDTDQKRYIEGATDHLIDTLQQVGINFDEGPHTKTNPSDTGKFGPYIQSERTEIYRTHAQILQEKGAAYRCFCTAERLEEMRTRQAAAKLAPMYDRTCLKLTTQEIEAKIEAGESFVIRQKIPHGRTLSFKDHIRGQVKFETSHIDDQVLMKSDNFPTYHLANVVDDHTMEITHVIRGEEWLPSTPKHLLLYEAFGWNPPEYAHLPLLLNKDKTKLSKRQGDVSVESYLQKGYTIEALINFIALLGWHPGSGVEQEIFSLEELIREFSLEKVHKAGAIFDLEKLNWFNYQWQKKLHQEKLAKIAHELDEKSEISTNERGVTLYKLSTPELEQNFQTKRGEEILKICQKDLPETYLAHPEVLKRALITLEDKVLKDLKSALEELSLFFETTEYTSDLLSNEKMKVTPEIAKKALETSIQKLESFEHFESEAALQELLMQTIQELELKNGQLLWPMRSALSCRTFSPGVFELLWSLGKEESLKRLKTALSKLE